LLKVEAVNPEQLRPHPKNPRVHPDSAIQKLVQSIEEYGWTAPILVSADGLVLAGHARLKAARQAQLPEVPVIRLPLEGAKAEAYMVADNRLQEETDWDWPALKDLLEELSAEDFDVELTGFETSEIEFLNSREVPAEEPEYEESIAEEVETVVCPECGHEFPL